MKILLDTSFILTCLKEGIDFLEAENFGKLVLPSEVINELKKLKENKKGEEKLRAELALDIIGKTKDSFEIIDLNSGHVDSGIINFVKNRKIIVATMDKELKKKLKNKVRVLSIRARKKLELS